MIKDRDGNLITPSFRRIEPEDFSTLNHCCEYFDWEKEAFYEENSHVFMCHFPGQDNEALGFISLIPYVFEGGNEGGYVEIYLVESTYDYVGTHLVGWACKMGINWFKTDVHFFIKAVPKHDEALAFFEAIGAEEDSLGYMVIYPEAAKELIQNCGL